MDIKKLFEQMDQVREKMEAVTNQMNRLTVTKETGAGLVQVTVSGDKKLLSVSIDETLFHKTNRKMVQDLIVSAANLALEEVDTKVQEVLQQQTGGL